ncbi:MAG: elongation factor G [Geminicoccaceae bacterium]|nr:elongation factor G [Geminicoccaceae bacterium]MCX8100691.1 elongation factor G [Geminicoccaceae bacterium]MDW8371138.1 elongation factor G [Geminicoccaceae bacterium]
MDAGDAKRNVALVGPNGVGKTTLFESLLFVTGTIPRKGRVMDKNTVGDASPEARERQMSTEVTAATLSSGGLEITLLDCPGSVEFAQEARAALMGVDLAVVVVEPVLERMIAVAPLLHFLDSHAVPHLVFINKMDRSEVRYRDLLDALRKVSARPVIPHQYAIGRGDSLVGYIDLVTEQAYAYKKGGPSDRIPLPEDHREREQAARRAMLETLADFDDDLLEKLLEDQEPPTEQILADLRKTLGADQVVPVFMGVAEHDMGSRRLVEALVAETPSPSTRAAALGIPPEGPTLAQVLKTWHLPHTGKLSLVRVWRGTVEEGMQLAGMRVGGVYRLLGANQVSIGKAGPGSIVALSRLEDARTGQVLSNGGAADLALPTAAPLPPLFAYAITAANRNDEVKLSAALAKLVDEDPSLSVEHDPEMHQTLLWGQGEMHLKVALDRMRSKYNIRIEPHAPRTPYRETIRASADAHGRHKKQSGGHGQFGDVKIHIEPLPRGTGFRFENRVVGGAVPKQFIPAVEEGAKEFLQKGPLGFPVVDVAITLNDGQYHTVDSNELSFKMATALALKEGLPKCQPVLLEPILAVTISVPSDYTSKALQLVTQRRGQILGYEAKEGWPGWDAIKAHIPQGEMHDLIVSLRSLSQGTGFFEWSFDHLQEVPDRLAQAIVEKHREAAAAH